jgi:hypothetical protein
VQRIGQAARGSFGALGAEAGGNAEAAERNLRRGPSGLSMLLFPTDHPSL